MLQSNVSLSRDSILFCRETLQALGYGGYYDVDWAGSAASGRGFYRIKLNNTKTAILMDWNGEDPDWDYLFALHEIEGVGSLSPKILGSNRDLGLILLEDGGSRRVKDLLYSSTNLDDNVEILKPVVDALVSWQNIDIPRKSIIMNRVLDRDMYLWETSYFAEHILPLFPTTQKLFNKRWESDRAELAKAVTLTPFVLGHRDFQSENILVKENIISFVDVQGARRASPYYDLASLIYDPYIFSQMNSAIGEELIDYYSTKVTFKFNRNEFYYAAMQRLMQALGAYGNLSKNKGKTQYLKYIEPAIYNFKEVLSHVEGFDSIKNIVTYMIIGL